MPGSQERAKEINKFQKRNNRKFDEMISNLTRLKDINVLPKAIKKEIRRGGMITKETVTESKRRMPVIEEPNVTIKVTNEY